MMTEEERQLAWQRWARENGPRPMSKEQERIVSERKSALQSLAEELKASLSDPAKQREVDFIMEGL